MKTCSHCKVEKEISQFHKTKKNKDSFAFQCKECSYERGKIFRNSHREQSKKWRKENKDLIRNIHYKNKYNLSLDQYLQMYAIQQGNCLICKGNFPSEGKYKALVVDHCHQTGKIRGLLCNNCNRCLGLLNDDIEILENAIKHLRNK